MQFFQRKINSPQENILPIPREYSSDGIRFIIDDSNLFREHQLFLDQLRDLGYVQGDVRNPVLSWSDFYDLLEDEALKVELALLDLPPVTATRVALHSRGALSDHSFSISVREWLDEQNCSIEPAPRIEGAVLHRSGQSTAVSRDLWNTMKSLVAFAGTPQSERTVESNRLAWGKIRRFAVKARCELDAFLRATVVVEAEKLSFDFRRVGAGAGKVTEIIPSFNQAPAEWLALFDRYSTVQTRYDVATPNGVVQVIFSPEAQDVLREIKRLPNRRAAGARAEAFERNPLAALGPIADGVIDPDEFEAARIRAGLGITEFQALITRDDVGLPTKFALRLETIIGEQSEVAELPLRNAGDVASLVRLFESAKRHGAQSVPWNGFDLEILGKTIYEINRLVAALVELKQGHTTEAIDTIVDISLFADNEELLAGPEAANESFDPLRFAARIAGFGEERVYHSPYIYKKSETDGWFPDNIEYGLYRSANEDGELEGVTLGPDAVKELRQSVDEARAADNTLVAVPALSGPVRLQDAITALHAIDQVQSAEQGLDDLITEGLRSGRARPIHGARGKLRLVLRDNFDSVDYREHRDLLNSTITEAVLPNALLPSITLHSHQRTGIAWLQNLWRRSPHDCSGALLADDMGLGKTLQLLTFIQSILEDTPDADPFIVVAPIALLDNWKREAVAFFGEGRIAMLTLHGKEVAARRKPKETLRRESIGDVVVDQLIPNWIGDAKVVLTTYECLRDLEYSFALIRWSAIICDEAQRIKNPSAMVTRAAMKQNARFRIACSGTPVENTLVDLWSLFDFIQPGLLGSLKTFGNTYRAPIEAGLQPDPIMVEALRRLIEPQMLRRMKTDIAVSLPRKLIAENCRNLLMNRQQAEAYEEALRPLREKLGGKPHLAVLRNLSRICSDPGSVGGRSSEYDSVEVLIQRSPKMAYLVKCLTSIREANEKAIVFCDSLDMQRTLKNVIERKLNIAVEIVNGSTTTSHTSDQNREKKIASFQSAPGFGVIILSPLAVGFGVNIQKANHVVHFMRMWNPAKEDQATDRAYRIGQTKDVVVYCPIVTSPQFMTFDVKLDRLLEQKRQLSKDILSGDLSITEHDFE